MLIKQAIYYSDFVVIKQGHKTREWECSLIINEEIVNFNALISSVRAPMQTSTD